MAEQEITHDSMWESYNESPYMDGTRKGLDEALVRYISKEKNEPAWMLDRRLESLKIYQGQDLPTWGPDLTKLDLDKITYYAKASDKQAETWDDVPADIKDTFNKLGIPQAEQRVLAGVGAQYESTVVYHNLKKKFKDQELLTK